MFIQIHLKNFLNCNHTFHHRIDVDRNGHLFVGYADYLKLMISCVKGREGSLPLPKWDGSLDLSRDKVLF